MASSNRHWPSLFKAKPCNSHLQWQHDINSSSLLPNAAQKASYSSAGVVLPGGCEERSPEPKPRWNPKPEQIRILEAIFNSGMVNPPRDEIRRIRAQLQEYGQVGDANVFYWFQNRKSRSKHKQRHLQSTRPAQSRCSHSSTSTFLATAASVAASSSSSSSERSTGSEKTTLPVVLSSLARSTTVGPDHEPIPSVAPASLISSFFQQMQTSHGREFTDESLLLQQCPLQEYCFSTSTENFASLVGVVPDDQNALGLCNGLFSTDHLLRQERCKSDEEEARLKTNLHHHSYGAAVVTAATITTCTSTTASTAGVDAAATASTTAADTINDINIHGMGAGACGATRSVVFINGVAVQVGTGPLNVREAFGDQALLLHSSGHPVLVDEWGITLQPFQPGASYYLVALRDGKAPVKVASPLVVNAPK